MCSRHLLLLALLLAAPLHAQQTPAPQAEDTLTFSQQASRDALLKPGLDQLKANHPADAYAAFGPALSKYPADLRVLRYSAEAALLSSQYQTAVSLFDRALATHPQQPWPLRLGRMQALAQIASETGRWNAFDEALEDLRTAKKSGDLQLATSEGFIVDQFQSNGAPVAVVFYPAMSSRFHTLYRFLLPPHSSSQPATQAATTQNDTPDRCQDPGFQPYIDLESDDVDQAIFQKAHPDLAAKGGREYSLDNYPGPCSQGLIRFYDGEPKYESLRADLIKILTRTAPAK